VGDIDGILMTPEEGTCSIITVVGAEMIRLLGVAGKVSSDRTPIDDIVILPLPPSRLHRPSSAACLIGGTSRPGGLSSPL